MTALGFMRYTIRSSSLGRELIKASPQPEPQTLTNGNNSQSKSISAEAKRSAPDLLHDFAHAQKAAQKAAL